MYKIFTRGRSSLWCGYLYLYLNLLGTLYIVTCILQCYSFYSRIQFLYSYRFEKNHFLDTVAEKVMWKSYFSKYSIPSTTDLLYILHNSLRLVSIFPWCFLKYAVNFSRVSSSKHISILSLLFSSMNANWLASNKRTCLSLWNRTLSLGGSHESHHLLTLFINDISTPSRWSHFAWIFILYK